MARSEENWASAKGASDVPLSGCTSTAAPMPYVQRHFDIAEIAQRWNLSPDTIRRLFENEPGVLILGETRSRRGKRRYLTLRIPESVLARVHRRLSRV
jgi:hypothetical protein